MAKRPLVNAVGSYLTPDEFRNVRIPRGSLRGDIEKQMRGRHWLSDVRYYYVDVAFTCRECGREEVWTAARQKHWYEELGGDPNSIAVLCRACRKHK